MAFLTEKELKLYLLIVAAVTILVLGVTVTIMFLRNRPVDISMEANSVPFGPTGIESLDPAKGVFNQLVLPEEFSRLYQREWKPFRPRFQAWNKAQVDEFWLDPGELVRKELEARTDREMEDFFEELP